MESRKIENETARLLYVATTRARRGLHLLGTLKTKDDGSIAEPAGGSFMKLLWPTMGQAFAAVAGTAMEEAALASHAIRRVPADWVVAAAPEPVVWTRRTMETVAPSRITFEWVGDRLRHAGTALHGLLERVAREGVQAWDEKAIRSRRHVYRAVLANLGVSPEDLADAVARVEAGLVNTLRDPRGRWILERRAEAECELPVSRLIEGKLYEAVIDRTFVDESGVRWIVDFKTGSHEGADVEAFLDNERERYREQLERYARLMVQRDERPIRLGLYFPLLGGWREWGAAVVLRKQATLFEM